MTTDAWWPGFEVEVTGARVVARRLAAAPEDAGAWPDLLAEVEGGKTVVAAAIPAESQCQGLPWLLLAKGETATVQLAPFALRVEAAASRAELVTRLEDAALGLGKLAIGFGIDPVPWQTALRNAIVARDASTRRTRVEVTGNDLDPLRLWPLWQ